METATLSQLVRLGGFNSVENYYLNWDMTPVFFEIFRIKIRAQASTFFSLRIFLYHIDVDMGQERKKCTPLRWYISRAANVVAKLNATLWVNERNPIMSFVLYTIFVERMCDASYVIWKYIQYRRYHVIFARKCKIFQKIKHNGGQIQ